MTRDPAKRVAQLTDLALDIPTVKSAEFRANRSGDVTGVVFDALSGVEFDVREDGLSWIVNDDDGRNFRSFQLGRALRRAIEANA